MTGMRLTRWKAADTTRRLVVYGLPVLLWVAMQLAPSSGHLWVFAVVGTQMAYFLANPSGERLAWVLLSYAFSVGGSRLSAEMFPAFAGVPAWMTWLSYVLIPGAICIHLALGRAWRDLEVLRAVGALALVGTIAGLLHGVTLVDLVGWSAHFLRYPLFFLLLVSSRVDRESLRRLLMGFLILAGLQVPIVVVGFFLEGGTFALVNEDIVFGTFYGALTGGLGLSLVVAFCAALSHALYSGATLRKLAVVLTLLAPVVLARAGFPLIASAVLAFYLVLRWGVVTHLSVASLRIAVRRRLLPGVIAASIALVVVGWVSLSYMPTSEAGAVFASLTDEERRSTYWRTFVDPSRAVYQSRQMFIATVLEWYRQHPEELLLGSIGPRYGLGYQRSLVAGSASPHPLDRINRAVGLPRTVVHDVVQLPRSLLEVGLAGLAFFGWLYWLTCRRGRRVSLDPSVDLWWRSQALAFEGIWLLFVVMAVLYRDIWRLDQTCLGFWLWAAALTSVGMDRRSKHSVSTTQPWENAKKRSSGATDGAERLEHREAAH